MASVLGTPCDQRLSLRGDVRPLPPLCPECRPLLLAPLCAGHLQVGGKPPGTEALRPECLSASSVPGTGQGSVSTQGRRGLNDRTPSGVS